MTATNPRIAPIERATQRTWDDWLRFLDSVGAADLDHGRIAQHVHDELARAGTESAGWWAQSVTVAYEQHVGRRLPGQQPDGTFQASVSRATPLAMAELIERWTAFAATDPQVEGLAAGEPRLSGTEKRMHWRSRAGDGYAVAVASEPRAGGTASLVVTLTGLPSPEASSEARERWTAAVTRFLGTV
ncbi:hypothetical protein AB6N24_13455 [Cellulomonas sp. 179-A 4D5 NHS]|uniref:hypothetical protein n=1 Tax=Cellulomonas sp. 179-A 4D5 NHS TaxID=3142378 RepID=UPI0039A03530